MEGASRANRARHPLTLIAAAALAMVVASAPALAQVPSEDVEPGPAAEKSAKITPAASGSGNADKVDGRHAVSAATPKYKRAGKLVATSKYGSLPNNIIKKAHNADKLDGFDSRAFARKAQLRSDTGAVNEADNLVHWNQLMGMPATFADGVDDGLPGPEGPQGDPGPKGDTGDTGPAGPKGDTGIAAVYRGTNVDVSVAAGKSGEGTSACRSGDMPISRSFVGTTGGVLVITSDQWSGGSNPYWHTRVHNTGAATATFSVEAVCLDLG